MTPGSVAEGTIVLLDRKLTKGPGDVGKVRHFPEGFGDISVVNALVPVVTRDKNPGFVFSSTADVNNNHLRQKMTTISVDGVATTIGTCAQNQTPELQTLLQKEDLLRVFSVVATAFAACTGTEAAGPAAGQGLCVCGGVPAREGEGTTRWVTLFVPK